MSDKPSDAEPEFFLQMPLKERQAAEILVCEEKINERNSLKMALRGLNYGQISDAPTLGQGLKKLDNRNFSHIVFQARKSDMAAGDFLQCALAKCPNAVFLATSFEPTVDNIFSLLIGGAKGYLVCPFTMNSRDNAIVQATVGDGFPEELLMAKNRNEALVSITMSNLDRVANTLRHAKTLDALKKQVPQEMAKLRTSSQMARTFCEGGAEGFSCSLETFSEKRSTGPATKLGRLRKRLNTSRSN
jgi:DNA-binding NtrC family response regulator